MVPWSFHRHSALLKAFLYLLLLQSWALADEHSAFDCHVTASNAKFDLTKLTGEHTLNRTRSNPPTTMVDSLRFNLCEDLNPLEGVAETDQCSRGTRACLTTVNQKPDEVDRIISVIPLFQATSEHSETAELEGTKYVSILFKGPAYPPSPDSSPIPQSLSIKITCDLDSTSDPKFVSYDNSLLSIEWSAPGGCPDMGGPPPPGDNGGNNDGSKEENVGSGIGWFFLVILLAFAAYFGLGAYYNYSTYGARGLDLIPHRDFWQDVPYMLKDVISHLCSSVQPRRSSRGGYVAV